MSKIIQCKSCYNAEDGEQLYLFDGHQYCSICLTDKLLNAGINEFSFGDFATSDRKSKDQRIAELEKQLENAIVPKFKVGDEIFAVVTYIADPKDKTVIESGIVQKIECDKNQIKYWCDNGRIYWEDECEKLFATEQEAQQKLKELEETK